MHPIMTGSKLVKACVLVWLLQARLQAYQVVDGAITYDVQAYTQAGSEFGYDWAGQRFTQTIPLSPSAAITPVDVLVRAEGNKYGRAVASTTMSLSGMANSISFSLEGMGFRGPSIPETYVLYTNFSFGFFIDLYLDQATQASLSFDRLPGSGALDLYQGFGASLDFWVFSRKGDLNEALYHLPVSRTIDPPDPDGDGVVFESLLPSGNYRFVAAGYGDVGGARGVGQISFQAVPEPSGLMTMLVALCVLFGCSRSR